MSVAQAGDIIKKAASKGSGKLRRVLNQIQTF